MAKRTSRAKAIEVETVPDIAPVSVIIVAPETTREALTRIAAELATVRESSGPARGALIAAGVAIQHAMSLLP